MMKRSTFFWIPLAAALAAANSNVWAEETMEEVVVQARLLSGAEALINERMDDDVVTDVIGADFMSRVGDTTVAAALRRVAGLTLVADKFVYVRGLGERYSSSTLNNATIPSPDLTRNVIPLDIFPTAIVESLAIQKSYSADRPANFGGGSVNIRTKGIPDQFTWDIEVSGGFNTETDGDLLGYSGGSDDEWGKDDGTRALPGALVSALARFGGDLNPQSIVNGLRREGDATAVFSDGQALNRQLALNLNRNISIKDQSDDPDWGIRGSIGDNLILTDELEVGFLVGGAYSNKWRKTETTGRDFTFPDQRPEREEETTYSVDINGNINLGARFTDDHELSTTTLYIRNTDDEVARVNYWNENREIQDGVGFRRDQIKFEEREMIVNQVNGEHFLGDATRELLPTWAKWLDFDWVPIDTRIEWYYSEARAFTDIPNEVKIDSGISNDRVTGAVTGSSVRVLTNVADYRFTELDDEVVNYAGAVFWPIETTASSIELSSGYEFTRKIRTYRQSQFGLGMFSVANNAILAGALGDVFSDANITDPANDYIFNLTGTNNQSYIAVTQTEGWFGKVDWNYNDTWRVSLGARYEEYIQVALDHDIYAFDITAPQVTNNPTLLLAGVFTDDKVYPGIAVTYMTSWWAEVFQLRFGYSETVVRPDLREITDASYVDARTGFVTSGDSSVIPSDIRNYDLRAEWFFSNRDNLTVSLYYKDIDNPIEFFEQAAADTTRARQILNADAGEVYGIEVEGLKELAFLADQGWGDFWESFFIQGNVTLQTSELIAGTRADAPTNPTRELAGASEYVVNGLLGFDSPDGKHSATLSYNVFGERLFSAGRLGEPDAFEQPFHSVDLTYSWYPTDAITVKFKAQNLLDETVSLEKDGVETFEEKPGSVVSITMKWAL